MRVNTPEHEASATKAKFIMALFTSQEVITEYSPAVQCMVAKGKLPSKKFLIRHVHVCGEAGFLKELLAKSQSENAFSYEQLSSSCSQEKELHLYMGKLRKNKLFWLNNDYYDLALTRPVCLSLSCPLLLAEERRAAASVRAGSGS